MLSEIYETFPVLQTERLQLKPIEDRDAYPLFNKEIFKLGLDNGLTEPIFSVHS